MNRRDFLKKTGIGAAAFSLTGFMNSAVTSVQTNRPPNILFIMADDLGPEWISCYGAEDIVTPNIDKLAAEGMRFENAYSMPKCTPTRATLLTGQYPFRHGWVNHWDVPRWGAGCHFDWRHNTTFAHILKKAGYTTAVAGKWQINDFRVTPDALAKHGFDEWCMWTGFESQNPPSAERYWDPYIHTNSGSKTHKGKFGEDVFTDFLIDFMKRNKQKPMMLYYPMALPHGPLVTTPAEPDVTDKIGKFKAMVRYVDLMLGKLVKAIDQLSIRKNTVILWSTDNGTSGGIKAKMNGRSVSGGKGKISENGCREPFIASCPGLIPTGVVTDALTDFTDLLPTFLELAGVELPEDLTIDGHSIAPLLLGKAKDSPRKWIMAMGGGVARIDNKTNRVVPAVDYADRVIRDKQYKLWIEKGKPTRLFDLSKDPGETDNLIDSTDQKALKAKRKFTAVLENFPKKDGTPKYTPTPPKPWDKKREIN